MPVHPDLRGPLDAQREHETVIEMSDEIVPLEAPPKRRVAVLTTKVGGYFGGRKYEMSVSDHEHASDVAKAIDGSYWTECLHDVVVRSADVVSIEIVEVDF